MDDKSKKKKKKLKQKQKQKQQQSVVVNVNLAKSRKNSSSEKTPPIHKVYASPIHYLTPQIFNKDGKQIAQPTLVEQMLEKYLKNQEQQKQANILGSAPQPNIALAQSLPPQKSNIPVSTDKFKNTGKSISYKARGRPPGALGKGPRISEVRRQNEEARERTEELERENKSQSTVLSILASDKVAQLKSKTPEPPPQFNRETTSLNNPSTSDDDEQVAAFYESPTYPSNLTNYLQFSQQKKQNEDEE